MHTIINDKRIEIITFNTFSEKGKGLMFRKTPIKKIYMFKKCSSIHTFFMFQSIDVCILDKNYKIVYLKEKMKKNRILIKKGYYTLEMPLGSSKHLKIGDLFNIKTK